MPIWSPAFFGSAAGSSGFAVEDSVWFDGSADFMTWTPGSAATSRRIQTWSWWQKLSLVSKSSTWMMVMGNATSGYFGFYQNPGDHYFSFTDVNGSTVYFVTSNRVFRDPTAWMHLCVGIDTTQGSIGDRFVLEVNGVAHTSWSSNTLVQNTDLDFGDNGEAMYLGSQTSSPGNVFNGYLAQFAFVDGTKHNAATFTETNDEGILIPKNLASESITWGTNGFLLEFKETGSGQDANGIGADTSGRNNHWAVGGGAIQSNQVTDSPTNSGTDTGNQCTFNPIFKNNATNNPPTFSNGNLTATSSSGSKTAVTTIPIPTTGKWSCKTTKGAYTGSGDWFNLQLVLASNFPQNATNPHDASQTIAISYQSGANTIRIIEEATVELTVTAWGTGTGNVEMLVDRDANTIKYYMNGSVIQDGGSDYVTNIPSFLQGEDCWFGIYVEDAEITIAMNYAASDADYRVALATQNLPELTYSDPSVYFQAKTYAGNGSTQSITLDGNSDLQPDLVWIKNRGTTDNHCLADSVRGVGLLLHSNGSWGNQTQSTSVTAFGSDGFSLGAFDQVNTSSENYVAWCWKAGGAPSADNTGDRTPTNNSVMKGGTAQTASNYLAASTVYPKRMSIADHGGFSIVKWTAASSPAQHDTVPHGLSVTPQLVFIKDVGQTAGWRAGAYNGSTWLTGFVDSGSMDTAGAASELSDMTSTHLKFGKAGTGFNEASQNYIAYFWGNIEGVQKFGVYTGNAAADGKFVYLGFKPSLIWRKKISGSAWSTLDNKRDPYNPTDLGMYITTDAAESDGADAIDILSNGFKMRSSDTGLNASTPYIYAAFAATPFSLNNRAR